jgi:hypothetical protein
MLDPSANAPGVEPLRQVTGQVLTSPRMPAVRLTFDAAFKYVGNHRFIL